MSISVNLVAEELDISTGYILIDLSDVTNFPHVEGRTLRVEELIIHAYASTPPGIWNIHFGIVLDTDQTDGSVNFFHMVPVGNSQQVDSVIPYLSSVIGASIGSETVVNDVSWRNNIALENTLGIPTFVGVGDLVLLADRISGNAKLSFSITVLYDLA